MFCFLLLISGNILYAQQTKTDATDPALNVQPPSEQDYPEFSQEENQINFSNPPMPAVIDAPPIPDWVKEQELQKNTESSEEPANDVKVSEKNSENYFDPITNTDLSKPSENIVKAEPFQSDSLKNEQPTKKKKKKKKKAIFIELK